MDDLLVAVLERSREIGHLGRLDVMFHVEHSLAFVELLDPAGTTVVDLGSGGGVPGLVIARCCPDRRVTLLDGSSRRCEFLEWAVAELQLTNVDVISGRAEEIGRRSDERGASDIVTARSFGPPAVVAECAAPLLRVGGQLVVSEPPTERERWDPSGLAQLGLVDEGGRRVRGARFRVLRADAPCPDEFPRRTGVPSKRPLFS